MIVGGVASDPLSIRQKATIIRSWGLYISVAEGSLEKAKTACLGGPSLLGVSHASHKELREGLGPSDW